MTSRVSNFVQAAASVNEFDDYMNKFSLSLVSNIINLGQHYRLWLTKQNIDSRIILFWNYPIPEEYKNKIYIPTYRTTHNDRYRKNNIEVSCILERLEEAYKFIKDSIKYVNEVYLINPLGVEASVIPLLLDREVYQKDGFNYTNILVSNNTYELIYANYGFKIICPSIKKKVPSLITDKNVIEVLKDRNKISSVLSVSPNFIEFIISLLGDSDRSIPKISGVGLAAILKMINTAIDLGKITENTRDIDMLKSVLREDYVDIFQRNYHSTNLELQLRDIEPVEIHKILGCLEDNYDDNTLMAMNEEYFKQFPIEIIKPRTQQVLYDNQSPYKSIFSK